MRAVGCTDSIISYLKVIVLWLRTGSMKVYKNMLLMIDVFREIDGLRLVCKT